MDVCLFTPASSRSRVGNRVTALRWALFLRKQGHRVRVVDHGTPPACDVLFALHALKSSSAVDAFRAEGSGRPVVVVLTGTDLYADFEASRPALEQAERIVVLQEGALERLPGGLRGKARVLRQSAAAVPAGGRPRNGDFVVSVIGHLRAEKDPLLTARAVRRLPPSSRIKVEHVGGALDPEHRRAAEREAGENPRYRWLGELPRRRTLERLASSDLFVLSSTLEGGANVLSEALAASVPILSTRIDAALSLLGADHPGLFEVGDEAELARLIQRCEDDPEFLAELRTRGEERASRVDPRLECEALARLLEEVAVG